MKEYVALFQDWLRKNGFPGFKREHMQRFVFGPDPETETSSRWKFLSKDKTERVILTQDFIVYETSNYLRFTAFTERLAAILSTLNSIAEIDYVSQIGLRYVDVIHQLDGYPPSWFIREQLKGLPHELVDGCQVRVNQSLSVLDTPVGELRLRVLAGTGQNFLPPDLEQDELEFKLKLNTEDEFKILDFDHIWKGEIDFDADPIIEKLWDLHASVKQTFEASVTEEALTVWERGEGE